MNSITYDICGEQKVLKVESDLILVIFMGESRKWHTVGVRCGGSDAFHYLVGIELTKKILTYLLPGLL